VKLEENIGREGRQEENEQGGLGPHIV
jgi:hypothetical protein